MRIYTNKQVKEILGNVSDTTTWRMEKSGLLPRSFKITARLKAFDADLVDNMIAKRAAETASETTKNITK